MNVSKCVSGVGSRCRGLMKRDISPVHTACCSHQTSSLHRPLSLLPPLKSDFPDELQ